MSTEVKKVIVVGDSSVGKTSVILKYTDGDVKIGETLATIGVDFKNKMLNVGGKDIRLQIWDTAGQEKFRNIAVQYFRRAQGIAVFYDVTSKDSFDHIPSWMDSIKNQNDKNVPVILIGNKCDLPAKISADQGRSLASEYGVPFFLTSAADGTGINEAFEKIANLMLDNKNEVSEPESLKLTDDSNKKDDDKKKCC